MRTSLFEHIKRNKTACLVSLGNTILLLLLGYFLGNQPILTGEDLYKYALMEWIKSKCGLSKDIEEKKDALFVNVAYDKQLINRLDSFGVTVGNVDITDRAKLRSFLEILQRTDAYTYIFMDVRFEKGFNSPEDSALFSQIRTMRNIVIANHSDIELSDSSLVSKSALNDYPATIIETNFTRYEYLRDNQPSVALFAYRELTGKNIDKHFLFYTSDHQLCYKSLFINAPIEDWSEFNEQQEKMYYNLGSDLLANYSDEDIATLTKEKYIVIGDMVEDMHDTYSGSKPGSVITFYAFIALMNGEHMLRYGLLFILGLLYFTISLSLLKSFSIIEIIIPCTKRIQSKFMRFCISLIDYSFLLLFFMIILNMIFDTATSIILPSLYFAFLKTIINLKREKI